MTDTRRYYVGVACVVLYIVIASSQSVALNYWLAEVDVYLVVGSSFAIVAILFLIVALATGSKRWYRFVATHLATVIGLNVAAVFNWLFYFLAVKYLPPALAVTLTQGIGAVSMSAWNLWRGIPVSRVSRLCHAVVLACASVMCVDAVWSASPGEGYSRWATVAAILIAILCSVSITATVLLSKTFASRAVPASVVLSVRFPLLIITCGAVLPFRNDVHLDRTAAVLILAVALVGISSAAYVLQRGVELAPPIAVSTCLALSPLAVFVISAITSPAPFDGALLALILTIVAVSAVSVIHDGRRLSRAT
ncbi:MAG: DMT family transporter [Gordonia sp. (in: high G+C Gram-positive bacteria)]